VLKCVDGEVVMFVCSVRWRQGGAVVSSVDWSRLQLPRQRVPHVRHHRVTQLRHSSSSSSFLC